WQGEDCDTRYETVMQRHGTADLPELMAKLGADHPREAVIVDPVGPAASLLPKLARAGVKVTAVNGNQVAQATAMFYDAVEHHTMRYRRNEALDRAIENATQRPIGDGGWAWSRKTSKLDITPLVSASLALWGSET